MKKIKNYALVLILITISALSLAGCIAPKRVDPFAGLTIEKSRHNNRYDKLSVALLLSENTKNAIDYVDSFSTFTDIKDSKKIFKDISHILEQNFKSVIKIDRVEEAKKADVDMILLLDMFAKLPNSIFGDIQLETNAVFMDLNSITIDKIQSESTNNVRKSTGFGFGSTRFVEALDLTLEQMSTRFSENLLSSTMLADLNNAKGAVTTAYETKKNNNLFSSDLNTQSVPRPKQAPPKITILSPDLQRALKLISKASAITVIGRAYNSVGVSKVSVNGNIADLDEQGNFSTEILLKVGDNQITVSATDIENNTSTETFTIAREAGQVAKPAIATTTPESVSIGTYHALIIGVKEYTNTSIPSLDYPLIDAQKIHNLLTTGYTFDPQNVTFLENPNHNKIIEALDNLANKVEKGDSLLVFYAGHGYWDEKLKQGYWLPSDASIGSRAQWLSNSTLRDYINGINSKHTLLVSDACFSGGILKTRNIGDTTPRAMQELFKLPSRKAMTSGMIKEVPDRSVFTEYLLKRLKDNNEQYMSSEQLFSSLRQAVINNSPNAQIPQFGEIRETGDEGGDFIFVKKP